MLLKIWSKISFVYLPMCFHKSFLSKTISCIVICIEVQTWFKPLVIDLSQVVIIKRWWGLGEGHNEGKNAG